MSKYFIMISNLIFSIIILKQITFAQGLSLVQSQEFTFNETSVTLRHFGENCSDQQGIFCYEKESLACINETCQCMDPSKMMFDTSKGLCVGRAGQSCVRHLSEKSVSYNKRNQCVSFASCETEGKNETCKCWSSFYQDEFGNCVRRREYLQKCDRDEHCNIRKGFKCLKELGVCACDSNTTAYNPDTERCAGLPNQECTNVYRECSDSQLYKCKAGICKCKFKEVEQANGTITCDPVRHKYGKQCGRFRGECGDDFANLRCLDGKCRCKNPDYQIYDYERRMCVSKIGGPCSISDPQSDESSFRNGTHNSKFDPKIFPSTQCIPYAECIPQKRELFRKIEQLGNVSLSPTFTPTPEKGICECGEHFIETKKGMCSLPFGSDCDTSSRNKKDQCSEPLKCVNSKCGCQNEVDIYDESARKCFKSVGSLCSKEGTCVQNSECKKRTKGKDIPGRCFCKQKFRLTSRGTCV